MVAAATGETNPEIVETEEDEDGSDELTWHSLLSEAREVVLSQLLIHSPVQSAAGTGWCRFPEVGNQCVLDVVLS
jgi:hypothetical protein